MIEQNYYQIPIIGTSIILCRFKTNNRVLTTVMESISEKEFKLLSDTNCNYNSPKYGVINKDDCFITKVNFEDNNFIDYINNIQLIKEEGFPIKTGFDFENSRIVAKNGKFTWYSTWDKLKVFKYKYCQIGKPKYVVIFNTFAKL